MLWSRHQALAQAVCNPSSDENKFKRTGVEVSGSLRSFKTGGPSPFLSMHTVLPKKLICSSIHLYMRNRCLSWFRTKQQYLLDWILPRKRETVESLRTLSHQVAMSLGWKSIKEMVEVITSPVSSAAGEC